MDHPRALDARTRVMHVTDTLERGGAEQVAVNLSNLMPRDRFVVYYCTTRRDGPLAAELKSDVGRLRLERRGRFDLGAIRRLAAFNRAHGIQILHAHGTALFIARAASCFAPHPRVVWHDHYGNAMVAPRPVWLYGLATQGIAGVIAVTASLAAWARLELQVPKDRVWQLPNFAPDAASSRRGDRVPAAHGPRIVCVANFRPQKDHLTLLAALERVVREVPTAELLLVGGAPDRECLRRVEEQVARRALANHVHVLGERSDVADLLHSCDVGVLSSASEGLPLALIEYGVAGLPVVATSVGECPTVLDHGGAGLLVPPQAPEKLADALIALLANPARRAALAKRLSDRVRRLYSPAAVIDRLCGVYDRVLASAPAR